MENYPNWYEELYPNQEDKQYSLKYVLELDRDMETYLNNPMSWKAYLKLREGRKYVS